MEIAATLIVRDEARCLARCLASVAPWVDRIVVLDTGSTDGTPELAREAGASVHHCAWPGDFSAARNRALDLADADWNLIVDADECIERGGELLRGWCSGPSGAGRARLGQVCIHSSFDATGNPSGREVASSRSWITRVIPRGSRFAGRVHEQVASALPRQRIDLHLGHDGYRDAQMAAKRDRNRALLLAELAAHPGDIYLCFQLGREAEGQNRFAEACDWYGRAAAPAALAEPWLHDLVVRHLHCLSRAGRHDDALALAERHRQRFAGSPDFFFVTGNVALECAMADPGQALDHWLPLATSCWERCLELGERPDLEGSVEGRGSHLARHNLDLVRGQLGQLGR